MNCLTTKQAYYKYSDNHIRGTFVDHNDKIPESDLTKAFTYTSKVYQDKYKEAYSECTCWYCEAVRESHTSSLSLPFSRSKKVTDQVTDQLHSAPSDPSVSAHISAHNAVSTPSSKPEQSKADRRYEAAMAVQLFELERNYQKALCARPQEGPQGAGAQGTTSHTTMATPSLYPIYYPYAASYGIGGGGGVYYSDPTQVTTAAGAYGNCVAGYVQRYGLRRGICLSPPMAEAEP